MTDLLRIKRRPIGGAAGAPSSLLAAELAFNEVDETLWYGKGNSAGMATAIIPIAGSGAFPALGDGRWVRKTGDQMSGGLSFGQRVIADGNPLNLTQHLSLFDGWGGFSVTSGNLNLVSGAMLTMSFNGAGANLGPGVGLYLDHDPVNAMEAVPLRYLQANYLTPTQGDDRWVNVAGDWMQGALGFGGMTNKIEGGGDAASSTINNLMLTSWQGIGFYPSVTAGQIPTGNAGIYFDVRNGFGNFRRVYLVDAITDATQAVTKQYVDTNTITPAAGDLRWVNVGGDTMSGALVINAYTPPWGGFNFAAQLVITGVQNNGIGIFDSGNANGVGIINGAGRLSINGMPPLGDSTTPPVERVGFSATEATFSTPVQVNSNIYATSGISGDVLDARSGKITIASNPDYYFGRNSSTGQWSIVEGTRTVFAVDPNLDHTLGTGTFPGFLKVNNDPVQATHVVPLRYLQANYATLGALGNYVAKTGDTMTGPLRINHTPTDTSAQLWLSPSSGALSKSIIRFNGTFAAGTGDGGPRYVASLRSGFSSWAWGDEHLDIWLTNTANDANSDAGQARAVRFTLGVTTIDTPVAINRNLAVYGVGNDPMAITAPQGSWARYFSTVTNIRTWAAGTRGTDGAYVISDENALQFRFTIDTSGNATVLQGLTVGTNLNIPSGGLNFINGVSAGGPQDSSRGITFWGNAIGPNYSIVVTDSTLNYNVFASTNKHDFYAGNTLLFRIQGGDHVHSYIPFQAYGYIQINGDPSARVVLNTAPGGNADFTSYNNGAIRWIMRMGTNNESGVPGESGGSEFSLYSYRNDGSYLAQPLWISRAGDAYFNFSAYVNNDPVQPTGVVNLRYLQANYLTPAGGDARWVNVGGDTMTGPLGVNPRINVNYGGTNLDLLPGCGPGAYNGIVQANDAVVLANRSAPDTGALTLTTWGNTTLGIRIDGAAYTIQMNAVSGINLYGNVHVENDLFTAGWLEAGKNTAVTPHQGGSAIISWNRSQGGGEVNYYNTYAPGGFDWRVVTGPGTEKTLMALNNQSNLYLYGVGVGYSGLPSGGSVMGFVWTGRVRAYVDGTNVGDLATTGDLGSYVAKSGDTMTGGLHFGQATVTNAYDTSRHITLYEGFGGFSVTGGTINIASQGNINFVSSAGTYLEVNSGGLAMRSGDVWLLRDPTNQMHATTKQYVDAMGLVINVKQFGATGNGSTDDTAAIQNAINSAGAGNLVFFPAGTYKTTAAITLRARTSIAGTGPSSIIAPATANQSTFTAILSSQTDFDLAIHDIEIRPTASKVKGIVATYADNLIVRNCTFSGCWGRTIEYDRCTGYVIADCIVRSWQGFFGGSVRVISSTWSSVNNTLYMGGNGLISRVRFVPSIGSWTGITSPAIQVVNQPVTHVLDCHMSWGAWGGGLTDVGTMAAPATFVSMEGQCQGNFISRNSCLGVGMGYILSLSNEFPNSICPTYVTINDNVCDSFGGIAILVQGTAAWPASFIKITGNETTETQRMLNSATPNPTSGTGSGYRVGDVLTGPAVYFEEEGSPTMLQVTAINGAGAITAVAIYNGGLTQSVPATQPVAYTGGSGTGAQFMTGYDQANSAIWLSHFDKGIVNGNYIQNYGGHVKCGVGIILDTVSNTQMGDNQVIDMSSGIYGYAGTNANILFTKNIMTGNSTADFGGNPPSYSLIQDNIGVPWLTTTPAMPANGVPVTNTAPYPQQVMITGGTIFGINVNGSNLSNGGPQWTNPIIVTLRPQHFIAISYTNPPSWIWMPMS